MRNQVDRFFVLSPIVLAAVEWKRLQPGDKLFVGYFGEPGEGRQQHPGLVRTRWGWLNSTTDCLTSHHLDKS